eukprot:CCRYP_002610-RA/>CCRYP_002610-RA protein AED:0.06 eAED:0.06 QI:255/1/1/1/0.33/0/4/2362/507
MHLNRLALLKALSAIPFFGSFALSFATSTYPNCNGIVQSSKMTPGVNIFCHKTTFGTFDQKPLLPHYNDYLREQQKPVKSYQNQRLSPLAMIPERKSQIGEQDKNVTTSSRPLTFLDATKRERESPTETRELIPEIPKESSALSPGWGMAQPIKNAITSIAETIATSKKLQGRVILLVVAFLYGTLNVTLRGIYAMEGAPVASVLSLVRQVLSVLAFIPLLTFSKNEKRNESFHSDESVRKSSNSDEVAERARPMWLAALELAFWNFGAQGLINAGLLFSPAARAAFLTQTSVVMTPLISRLAGETIKTSVWGGCCLALIGLYLISTSATDVADISSTVDDLDTTISFSQGDAMILLGALSWSIYIFRTSQIARSYSELDLQFTKNSLLALMYGGWFVNTAISTLASAGESFFSSGGAEALSSLWAGWKSPFAWLLLIYSAVGPGTVADLLQQKGQKETSASESNIILCLESVFATVCAFVLLGEVSSVKEIFGGAMIVLAAVLASR